MGVPNLFKVFKGSFLKKGNDSFLCLETTVQIAVKYLEKKKIFLIIKIIEKGRSHERK